MFEGVIFKSQQLKLTGWNLLAFTIIFTIFGIVVFTFVQNTLLSKPDRELNEFQKRLSMDNNFSEGPPINESPNRFNQGGHGPALNPRVTIVEWNKNGEIINKDQIGLAFYENYLQDLKFNELSKGEVKPLTLDNRYHFRSLLFKYQNKNGQAAYIQLLANVDPEQNILAGFKRLIAICSGIFILLSIAASLILSKKTMKPIIRSWQKQTEFVENASHELRTPLSIIQNKLELLLRKPEASISSQFEPIALSLSETRRLTRLTSDLLTLARADSAETQLILEPVQLDNLIKKLAMPFQEIAEAQDKRLEMKSDLSIKVHADTERLHQLFVILLDNALKYTESGDTITLALTSANKQAIIEVRDTGIGIKPEHMDQVFDRFFREDAARTRECGGAGLGLSIAQWIVREHNGSISVLANKPKGSIFRITMPL